MISILIPYYEMRNADFYISRCTNSIKNQTYKDIEIIIVEEGKTGHNINEGVKKCKGDIVKILCMDDFFTTNDSLEEIIKAFDKNWLINGVSNHTKPYYTGDVHTGNNRLGGLSSIAFKKQDFLLFDESLEWLLDCDWHKRMYLKYGEPTILEGNHVTIETGDGQATNNIGDIKKFKEVLLMKNKYK